MTLLLASFDPPYWLSTLIKVVVVSAVVPTTALILGMVFLFKIMSWMQSRLGPQEAGPRGTLQLLADGVKFLQKEDIAPNGADRWVFKVAPLVVLMSTLLLYVALPASMRLVVADLDVGVFFVLAISSLSVIGVLMAGWASASKYSLMGALRAAGQLIAYELPMVLAVVGVIIQAGTMSLNGIVFAQADGAIFGWGGIGNPYILTQF
ncbi:MAG: NADH-quinone oxidoreductase subunit H, partial [Actinobacteria bacterium]|nr:NADH-quinone oxidoreductase subunit H [Actinomycetota bacterium]